LKKEVVKALRECKTTKIDRNCFLEAKRRYTHREKCRKNKKQKKKESGERDEGNKNREGGMEMHKL
jgi:hypothetical protein